MFPDPSDMTFGVAILIEIAQILAGFLLPANLSIFVFGFHFLLPIFGDTNVVSMKQSRVLLFEALSELYTILLRTKFNCRDRRIGP